MAKNLDDDFDEINNPNRNSDEVEYTLTPKGVLFAGLLESKTLGKLVDSNSSNMLAIAEEIFYSIETYARKHYGKGENVAAIIFNTNGGMFTSVRAEEEPFPDEDNDE